MNRIFYILMFLLLGVVAESNATPRPPSPPGLAKKVPINAGIALLLVAGVGLGVKKLKKSKEE